MKSILVMFCLLLRAFHSVAQNDNKFSGDDRIGLNIPVSQTNSVQDIADYVNKYSQDDLDKVRSIYAWVITNITYDKNELERIILNQDRDKLVTTALKKRKGVCEHFAALFTDICKKTGLRSFMIGGYTRQNGSVDGSSHAWCAVLVDSVWSLYDPTWDAASISGYRGNLTTNYFRISPSVFIQTHMPFDPMFQFLNYSVSYDEFNKGRIKGSDTKYFDYADTINVYEKLDFFDQYLSSLSRIENNGSPNELINTKMAQLKMEIEIINQDKDSIQYNNAIADYNAAISLFNSFLAYRNNQFKPAKTNATVWAMFDEMENRITKAHHHLEEVNHSKATLTLDTGDIEYALENLSKHVKEQKLFFEENNSTAKGK